jgi:alpha-glucuronidase
MQEQWLALKDKIEPNQFNQVRMALAIQVKEAKWWRDACVLYFQTYSKMPIPAGLEAPKHSLEYYQSLKFPYAPGQG